MQQNLHKKSILKKTAQIAGSTLASKVLALARSWFEIRYFGAGALSDAFWTAYAIPNILRKAFAEGALSAAFIPTLIRIVRDDKDNQASRLMTLTMMIIETIVFTLCFIIFLHPSYFILLMSPGFSAKPVELINAIALVRILIFFVLFISVSALMAGGMQARNHFVVPSWGPVLLNICYIAGLVICLYYQLPITVFAYFVVAGGVLLMFVHIYTYFKLGYRFLIPDTKTWGYFAEVMYKFLPSLLATSVMEINFAIDNRFVSYLAAGEVSIFKYAAGFLRIPLGTFAVAFSTILLSHFSRVSTYNPKRLGFYLLESSKFIFWVCLPATLLMSAFSYKFFSTIFVSENFSNDQAIVASRVLIVLLIGLFFFSLNKVLLSIYYSMHETIMPTIVTIIGVVINTCINAILVYRIGVIGIAFGTVIGGFVQAVLFLYLLHRKYNIKLYARHFSSFILRYSGQVALFSAIFYLIYHLHVVIFNQLTPATAQFMLHGIGFWLWTVPLSAGMFGLAYITRKMFKLKIYFLD